MEQKILKTDVFANEIIYSASCEQAIDVDFTLPDYCPDILKIFKCQSVPRISAKSINGKNIKIDGVVTITLIYADSDQKLCSFEYQYPFEKNIEITNDASNANLACTIKNEYINCRAVTGRKIDIHGAVNISVKVFKRKSTEIISDYDDCNIEIRRGVAPATTPMGYAEKYLMIEEEITVGQGQPPICNIIRYNSYATVKETKIINDKAVVKGEMCVNILYSAEDRCCPQSVKNIIPFSQIIDIEGITEECECETKCEISFLNIKPKALPSGEVKCFDLTAKLQLTSEAYCGNEIAVILDAFSRKYHANIIRKKVCFNKIKNNIRENFNCRKTISLDKEITSVADLWCNVQNISPKFEEDNLCIQGVLAVCMILNTEDDNYIYEDKQIDFEYKYPLEKSEFEKFCDPQINVLSCGFTIASADSIEIRPELSINASIYEKNEVSLISEMTVDENQIDIVKRKGAMTIYFSSVDQCVWDVARIYNASVEEIMKINGLESENLPQGKMILVPVM